MPFFDPSAETRVPHWKENVIQISVGYIANPFEAVMDHHVMHHMMIALAS